MIDASLLPVQTGRVRLRPLRDEDAAPFAAGTADPAVRRHAHLPEPDYTAQSVRAMIQRDALPGLERGDLAVLAIAEATTDEFAGSLVLFDVAEHDAEVGFWLHPGHRGSGITAEALDLATHLGRCSGLSALRARTLPENLAAQRVLVSAGFTPHGRDTGTAPSGRRVELLHYTRELDPPPPLTPRPHGPG